MNAGPLIANESLPLQTVSAMVRVDARLERELAKISLPLLIVHGTADRATRPSGSQIFHDVAKSHGSVQGHLRGLVRVLPPFHDRSAVRS